MNLLTDIVIQNISIILGGFFTAFLISFLSTPWAGKFALKVGAVDLPVSMVSRKDKAFGSRMNEGLKPRLGGIGPAIGFIVALILFVQYLSIPGGGLLVSSGLFWGIIIIIITGYLDDKYKLSGKYQLILQFIAAIFTVIGGTVIPDQISFLNQTINLNIWSTTINLGSFFYEFVFPGHIITIIWIVGILNVINWVGGVDGLNISVSSIIAFTMFLFAISISNIPLALLIAIFIGANQGLFPYNYNPSKIIPGSVSEYLNGYLLAIFALMGPTGWTSTLIVLSIPIIDGLIVIFLRMRSHPEVLRNPVKLLSINDQNHLHHRLLAVGYSRKSVMMIEIAIVNLVCTIAIIFGIDASVGGPKNKIIVGFVIAITLLILIFTITYVAAVRAKRRREMKAVTAGSEPQRVAEVKVVIEDVSEQVEEVEKEKFVY